MTTHAYVLDLADAICLVELVKQSDLNSHAKSDIIKRLRNPIPVGVINQITERSSE